MKKIIRNSGRGRRIVAIMALMGLLSGGAATVAVYADDASPAATIYIERLFEYPVAPEELPDLQTKSDWLMGHFWDSMNFGSGKSVDQNALNDAFYVYGSAMLYASRSKALESVDRLVGKLKGNSVLTLQFAKAAEEALYGPRANAWIDEAYIPFLKAVVADKGISESRKARYKAQLENLKRNAIGEKFPALRLTLRDGRHYEFKPRAEYTLVEIGNPDCDDCKFAKMKLEMASDIQESIAEKRIEMAFIVADAMPEDESGILKMFASYPEEWVVGISYGADEILDLRQTPEFYILGKKGEILAKNLDVSGAVEKMRGFLGERGINKKK